MAVEPVPGAPAAIAETDGERLLVVADYHAGIEAGLRYDGVELESAADGRRERLVSLVAEHRVDRVVVLGDLGHAIGDPFDDERAELDLDELPASEPAMDVGARTVAAYAESLEDAGTAILNGPAGVFEDDRFETGTLQLYNSATRAETSIVGGGDTASALRKLGLLEGFDHVSTGGGAALQLLTGDTLVGIEVLDR